MELQKEIHHMDLAVLVRSSGGCCFHHHYWGSVNNWSPADIGVLCNVQLSSNSEMPHEVGLEFMNTAYIHCLCLCEPVVLDRIKNKTENQSKDLNILIN